MNDDKVVSGAIPSNHVKKQVIKQWQKIFEGYVSKLTLLFGWTMYVCLQLNLNPIVCLV